MGKSIKDLCEFFWHLEEKYELLDFEIDGVKPWQFRRMSLYYELSERSAILEQAHPDQKKLLYRSTFKDKLKTLFRLLKNSVINNPFFSKKSESLIFSHYRSKLVNDDYIDIYTHYLKEELIVQNISFTDMERPFLGKHIRNKESKKRYLDCIVLLSNIFQYFMPVKLTQQQELLFISLNKDIKKNLGVDFDSKKFLINAVRRFKANYFLYSLLFRRIRPKEIFIVISYAHGDVIKVAKDLGILVNELQHGTFSKYHLGYSFPDRKKDLDYFPDNLFVWNKYWQEMMELPIKKENIKIKPFQYLETQKIKYLNNKKVKDSLIIISQGAISKQLAKVVLDNFSLFEHMQIHYKLHPSEYGRWKENSFLVELNSKDNVTIAFDVDLYALLSISEYQLGVFSTSLYEGVEFGCKTILAGLPGIEYMDKFIKYHQLGKKNGFYGRFV